MLLVSVIFIGLSERPVVISDCVEDDDVDRFGPKFPMDSDDGI